MSKYKKNYKSSSEVPSNESQTDEITELESRIESETPDRGSTPPLHQSVSFRSLPLSDATLRGLEQGYEKNRERKHSLNANANANANININKHKTFTTMTDIQNACIPHALAGRDILGAARTGSGKTLAFLIPTLERLYRNRFSSADGQPGGLVLSPTRELAMQIFQVLRRVGSCHDLSAGLLVGGKKEFRAEQIRVGRMNIIVGTPGRVLQHLEQTPDFDVQGLLMLVLDEADRILDMGFRQQMIHILSYLPPSSSEGGSRQTLLFSATQTKRVSDLAALSLHRPEYLGVHDQLAKTDGPTPKSLQQQSVVVVPLQHKLDAVYSFIKSHLQNKSIIFFSSCSQVRHVYEVFCTLQPGVPLLQLHGKIRQEKRTEIYFDFLQKPQAVLFATDVASRGLDFPGVDWVVQADAPEDKEMYVHRVGRTARYNEGGKALLCLLPSEEKGMMEILEKGRIKVKKLRINPSKTVVVSRKAAALLAERAELNLVAKKAYKSYVRSVHLMPNKDVFQVDELPLDEYANSLGLAATPNLRFLKDRRLVDRTALRGAKNVDRKLVKLKQEIRAEKLEKKLGNIIATGIGDAAGDTNVPSIGKKRRTPTGERTIEDEEEDDNGILVLKKKHKSSKDKQEEDPSDVLPDAAGINLQQMSQQLSQQPLRKPKRIRIDAVSNGENKRITFNDDGDEEGGNGLISDLQKKNNSDKSEGVNITDAQDLLDANKEYLDRVKERLDATREQDMQEEKDRIREKHKKKKRQEKVNEEEEEEEEVVCTLAQSESSDGSVEGESESEEDDSSSDESGSSSEEDEEDLKAKEDLALALIRGEN